MTTTPNCDQFHLCVLSVGRSIAILSAVIKRILLSFLLAWLAIAPAIASACVAECETMTAPMHADSRDSAAGDQSDVAHCHGTGGEQEESKIPDSSSMAVACFVAGAVSLPSSVLSTLTIDLSTHGKALVLLPPVSFETSPLNKPPQG